MIPRTGSAGTSKMRLGEAILLFAFGVVVIIPGILWAAYAASIVWEWFIVPFGAPVLPLAPFVGAFLLKAVLFHRPQRESSLTAWEKIGEAVGAAVFGPAVTLLLAWIFQAILF